MKRRHSIAGKVTFYVSVVLLITYLFLLISSLVFVNGIVTSKNRQYSRAIVGLYADLIIYDSALQGVPVDMDHASIAIRHGNYVCRWYDVEYAYIYVPNVEKGTVTYVCATRREESERLTVENHWIGRTVEYELNSEELAVWNGEKTISYFETDNKYGKVYDTIIPLEDAYGNRMIAGVDMDSTVVNQQIMRLFVITAIVLGVVLLLINLLVYLIIRKKVSRPAGELSEEMQAFITDGQRQAVHMELSGTREFDRIAEAFNSMSRDIDSYMENIRSLTRDQEHQQAELAIASGIQKSFLPQNQWLTPDYNIRCEMIPARDVGGDLYEYVPLDDHRVLVVVADVSGKGVSAAMFMAVVLTLIRVYATMNLSPGEILRRVNDLVVPHNPALMFATAFVAIYDAGTGKLTYANAGHNFPYVVGEELRTLNGEAGPLVGLFPEETYPENTLPMQAGDTLLLYTDGVNESVNSQKEFFGDERLKKAMQDFRKGHKTDLVSYMNEQLRGYVGTAEQHDDITMLALTVKQTKELLLDYDLHEMEKFKQAIFSLSLSRKRQMDLYLAAEERFVNICSYAFPQGAPEGEKIRVVMTVSDRIELRMEDGGVPFDPTQHVADPDEYDIDTQIGGLGNFIAFASVDEVQYEYKDGKNILTFTKYFEEENQ